MGSQRQRNRGSVCWVSKAMLQAAHCKGDMGCGARLGCMIVMPCAAAD